jgi:hypothetical protein
MDQYNIQDYRKRSNMVNNPPKKEQVDQAHAIVPAPDHKTVLHNHTSLFLQRTLLKLMNIAEL